MKRSKLHEMERVEVVQCRQYLLHIDHFRLSVILQPHQEVDVRVDVVVR